MRGLRRLSSAAENALVAVQRHGSRGQIAELTLNAPESLNALTDDMGDAFSAAVARLKTEPPGSLDAVLLSGAGRAFSAGGDVGFLRQRATAAPADNVATMRDFYRKFLCVRSLPVPTVACLHGPAVGAGLCVALACDTRVVAADARLGLTFVGLGLHPGMAATLLAPHLLGPHAAARLLLTAELVSGAEAARLGVGELAADAAAARDDALALARRLAAGGAPIATRETVKTLRAPLDAALEAALAREAAAQATCYASADYAEGVAALAEKRKPAFSGK